MIKALVRTVAAVMFVGITAGVPAEQAFAARTPTVSVLGAYPDGYGSYTVSLADSRPASKLVLYLDGTEVGRTVVSRHRRATFREVALEGVGKLSLAELRARIHGGHYLARLPYVRYFDAVEGHVRFSATKPAEAITPPVIPPAPASEPTSTPPSPPPVEPTCANGTYVNSEGNTVCKPQQSPTPPPGATARCRDGTYSFSEHRSGTCSYHGGVAEWLV